MLYNIFWIFCLLLSRKSSNFVALLWFYEKCYESREKIRCLYQLFEKG